MQASFSPDGRRLAYNQKAQAYWRKFYRGSYQSDVMIADVAAKKFSNLTDFDGMDSWPMWARDGNIYFVSDRDGGGLTNVWRVSESGGKADRVTTYKSGDVRWPSISADGKTIVFEHDFQIAKLDVASKRVTPLRFDIDAETGESLSEVRNFNSEVDDYDLAPNSRRIVLSVHGEIFTAPVEEGDLRQITDSPWRDRDVSYSPDGKWIAYVSDRSGREEMYVAAVDGAGEARKLTDLDALKVSYRWSPDSTQIAFTASDGKLRVLTVADGQSKELSTSRYGQLGAPAWSPDGKWIAYSKPDVSRTTDIYLVPAAGGEEQKVTFDSFSEASPRFSPDGRKLYFLRNESTQTGQAAGTPAIHIYAVTLERLERDPDDPEERAEAEAAQAEQQTPPAAGGEAGGAAGSGRRQMGAPRTPPRPVNIDWAGLKRRTRQLTRMPFPVTGFNITPDGAHYRLHELGAGRAGQRPRHLFECRRTAGAWRASPRARRRRAVTGRAARRRAAAASAAGSRTSSSRATAARSSSRRATSSTRSRCRRRRRPVPPRRRRRCLPRAALARARSDAASTSPPRSRLTGPPSGPRCSTTPGGR